MLSLSVWGPPAATLRALAQEYVGRALAGDAARALITQGAHIEALEERLSAAEQHRPHGEVQLIDETGAQILADGGHSPAEADVAAAGRGERLFESGVNAFRDKAKLGAAG